MLLYVHKTKEGSHGRGQHRINQKGRRHASLKRRFNQKGGSHAGNERRVHDPKKAERTGSSAQTQPTQARLTPSHLLAEASLTSFRLFH